MASSYRPARYRTTPSVLRDMASPGTRSTRPTAQRHARGRARAAAPGPLASSQARLLQHSAPADSRIELGLVGVLRASAASRSTIAGSSWFRSQVDHSAHGPIVGVARPQADRLGQVVDRLREALQLGQGMGAMVVGVGVVGIALEPRGVTLDQRRGRLGEMLEVLGQLAEIDLERRQGGAEGFGGVLFGIGRRVPVEAHAGQVLADGPQVPHVHGRRRTILGGHHQARPVGAEGDRRHAAQVGAFEPCERAAGLDLDQANDLARVHDDHQTGRRERNSAPTSVIGRSSRQVPTSQSRGLRISRHQPLPIGAEANPGAPIDGQLGHLRAIAECARPGLRRSDDCRSPTIARPG